MRKIIQLAVAAMILLLSGHAYAKIIYASGTANGEISLGFSNAQMYLDFDGDGKSDSGSNFFDRNKDILGAPDANNIRRHTSINSTIVSFYNPLTGALIRRSALFSHVLRFDENITFTGFALPEGGYGIFTVGTNRYFADMQGIETFLPVPMLIGTPYIDAALSIAVINAKTGAKVKEFRIQSNRTFQLLPFDCRFADINGVTYFIERWRKRSKTVPAGPGTIRDPLLIKVWNTTHTRLIKQYFQQHINTVLP